MGQSHKTSGSIVVNGRRIELMASRRPDGRVAVMVRDLDNVFQTTSEPLSDALRQAWRDALKVSRRGPTAR